MEPSSIQHYGNSMVPYKRGACVILGASVLTLEMLNHALTWGSYDGTDNSMSTIRYGNYFLINVSLLSAAGIATHYAGKYLNEKYVLVMKNGRNITAFSVKQIVTRAALRAIGVYTGASLLSLGTSSTLGRLGCECQGVLPSNKWTQPVNSLICKVKEPNCTGFSTAMNVSGRLSFVLGALTLIIYEIFFMIYEPSL